MHVGWPGLVVRDHGGFQVTRPSPDRSWDEAGRSYATYIGG